jgi:replicative DNA helicase Mcm
MGMDFAEDIVNQGIFSISGPISEVQVGFSNIPREYSPKTISDINESHIGHLMRVEGMVGQITDKYPIMTHGNFLCNRCDADNIIPQLLVPKSLVTEPSRCRACNKRDFRLIMEDSRWTVAQVMALVEKPDLLRAGQRPPSLQIFLLGDLTKIKFDLMGKIVIDGVLKVIPSQSKGQKFLWYLHSYNMEIVDRGFDEIQVTPEEEKKIKEMSKNPHLLEDIANSIAPNIHGHNELKKALVLQLLGGAKKTVNNIRRRDWMNLLVMGDPGVSKTQLLLSVKNIAPKAVYTTGTGSSEGGLTTTAEKDALTGEWMIKPGVIPMASGGVALIDEFNRLEADDIKALEEPMENGTCTASKAAKNVQFISETAHLCAGNPKLGRFDNFTDVIPQFGIDPAILSRFDLIFVIRDLKDSEMDKQIAHALFEAHTGKTKDPPLDRDMVKKYIAYAKQNYQPKLRPAVEQELETFYMEARKAGFDKGITSATPRNYEALVRLTEASAKLRLSKEATINDVQVGKEIIQSSTHQLSMGSGLGGILDVDTIVSGKPKNERDKYRLVELAITELSEIDGMADLESLVEKLEGEIPKDKLERILEELSTKGSIYSPQHGRYMMTGG